MEPPIEQESSTAILRSKPALADRFEVIEVLGEGASGAVYRVSDRQQNGREVALKILLNNSAFDENTLARFIAELRILQKVQHPNLVEAYDLIELGETIAFTMEYVPGSDLGRLFRERKLTYEEIDNIFYQVLSALHELHKNGIIHRDIKLENILVTKDGRVKLSDLGLMKCGDLDGMTKTGILLGTAQYMPPEYVRGSMYDHRGDIYAVGLMLYEILTSKRRLCDKSGNEALEYLIKTRFQVPKITLTGLPRKYLDIIDRALDPDPEIRFQSALSMRESFVKAPESSLPVLEHELPGARPVQARRFCELSAMSEALVRAERKHGNTGRRLIIALGILCSAISFPVLWKFSQHEMLLEAGEYEGTLNVKGSLKKLALDVSADGVLFSSALEDCAAGPVNLEDGSILCGRAGLQLRIDNQGGREIRGYVFDMKMRERYRFTVERVESAPTAIEKEPAPKKAEGKKVK